MTLARAIVLLNLALLTLCAYLGVGIFYQFAMAQIPLSNTTMPSAPSESPANKIEPHQLSYYRPALERDLFDTAQAPPVTTADSVLNVEDLAETELKLKLWGTVSGDDESAYAVIEDLQKREQNLYRTGDMVQDAVVKKIMRERVVLNSNGKDEILAMEEVQAGQAGPTRSTGRGSSQLIPSTNPTQPIQRAQRVSLRREMINEAMQDLSKLMTEITIMPHMEDGQAAGLAMTNIKPNSIFRRMGLRNGDVLKGVNGKDIRSVDDALQLYESLKDSDNVQVQLNRRGQDRVIDYNIR